MLCLSLSCMVRKVFQLLNIFTEFYITYSHCTDLSSSCICHTFDTQLSHSTWQLPGAGWHWKRTVSPVVAPGNDCRKLRHPPSVEQTLSPHSWQDQASRSHLFLNWSIHPQPIPPPGQTKDPREISRPSLFLKSTRLNLYPQIVVQTSECFESMKSQAGKQTE